MSGVIEFSRHVFKFKLDGEEYKVTHPTVKDIEEFESEAKADQGIETTIKFLEKLGLNPVVARSMEVGHLTKLVEVISGAKKN